MGTTMTPVTPVTLGRKLIAPAGGGYAAHLGGCPSETPLDHLGRESLS